MQQKNQEASTNQEETPSNKNTDTDNNLVNKTSTGNENESSIPFSNKRQHPLFERKVKVAGNDSFLKQIFS
jgi:hypothetical protein